MARSPRRTKPAKLTALPPAAVTPPSPVSPAQARVARQLHELAESASGYLRDHPDRSVRRTIALLAAATLAASVACGPSTDGVHVDNAEVQPAVRQANAGFPTTPGDYELRSGSIQTDNVGNYYLFWYTSGKGGALNLARGHDVKLVEEDRSFLHIESGQPPVLHLKADEPIQLVTAGLAGQAQPTP